MALSVRASPPRVRHLAAQDRRERRRRSFEPGAPRVRVGERAELGQDHVAHAVPPVGLVVELRGGAANVREQRDGVDVVLALVEEDHECARGVGVGSVWQVDDVLARSHAGGLRGLEPRRLLGVEDGSDLVGEGALRVPLQVALRLVEPPALVRGHPEGPVIVQVGWRREHLRRDGAPGQGARQQRTD